MDATESLLKPVGIPGQVVVHHQVRALKVDALTSSIGGEQHLDFRVVQEALLRLATVLATHAAVNHYDRLRSAQQGGDLRM